MNNHMQMKAYEDYHRRMYGAMPESPVRLWPLKAALLVIGWVAFVSWLLS